MRSVLRHPELDAAFKELVLTLPAETYIAEQLDVVDPQRIHAVREACASSWPARCSPTGNGPYEATRTAAPTAPTRCPAAAARWPAWRSRTCAWRRAPRGDTVWPGKAYQRFKDASNMTDRFNALAALVTAASELAAQALQRFHAMFKDEALVLDKWFALQAGAPDRGGNILPIVKQLMNHPDFNIRNPNRARSVIFSYCSANPGGFHRATRPATCTGAIA
jgi:aminopeptidase N